MLCLEPCKSFIHVTAIWCKGDCMRFAHWCKQGCFSLLKRNLEIHTSLFIMKPAFTALSRPPSLNAYASWKSHSRHVHGSPVQRSWNACPTFMECLSHIHGMPVPSRSGYAYRASRATLEMTFLSFHENDHWKWRSTESDHWNWKIHENDHWKCHFMDISFHENDHWKYVSMKMIIFVEFLSNIKSSSSLTLVRQQKLSSL